MHKTGASQLIRWAIPGWCFFLALSCFLLIYRFFTGINPDLINDVLQNGGGIPIFVVGTVSAIPLGFLIYQIYFYFWWTIFYAPREWNFNEVINKKLIHKCLEERCFSSIIKSKSYKSARPLNESGGERRYSFAWGLITTKIYKFYLPFFKFFGCKVRSADEFEEQVEDLFLEKEESRNHWALIQALWYQINTKSDYDNLIKEVQRDTSIFHSLGTTTFSVGAAILVFMLIQMKDWNWHLRDRGALALIYFIVPAVILFVIGFVFLLRREHAFLKNAEKYQILEGVSTTQLLLYSASFLLITYGAVAALQRTFETPNPVSFSSLTVVFLSFIISMLLIIICRSNRRDVIRHRNFLMAARFDEVFNEDSFLKP